MSKLPYFFILGNPRSGTSMFRMMLNANPNLVVPPECGFAHWLAHKYSSKAINLELYKSFSKDVVLSKKFETWGVSEQVILDRLVQDAPNDYEAMIQCVYLSYSKSSKIKAIGDKNNYFINHVPELKSLFPSAKYIHIVRDGRDVACSYLGVKDVSSSYKYKPKLPLGIKDIASEWARNNKILLEELTDNSLVVRYEDLIDDPERILIQVCEYLNVDFEPEMLRFYDFNDEPEELMAWKGKTTQEVDKDNKNKYLDIMTEDELYIFNECAKDMLNYFLYEI